MMSVPSEAVGAIKGLKGSKIRDPTAVFNTYVEVNKTGDLLSHVTIKAGSA